MKDGGQAFPSLPIYKVTQSGSNNELKLPDLEIEEMNTGMTLLDYFAGQVLESLVGSISKNNIEAVYQGVKGGRYEAKIAYDLAQAMIAERERRMGDGNIS